MTTIEGDLNCVKSSLCGGEADGQLVWKKDSARGGACSSVMTWSGFQIVFNTNPRTSVQLAHHTRHHHFRRTPDPGLHLPLSFVQTHCKACWEIYLQTRVLENSKWPEHSDMLLTKLLYKQIIKTVPRFLTVVSKTSLAGLQDSRTLVSPVDHWQSGGEHHSLAQPLKPGRDCQECAARWTSLKSRNDLKWADEWSEVISEKATNVMDSLILMNSSLINSTHQAPGPHTTRHMTHLYGHWRTAQPCWVLPLRWTDHQPQPHESRQRSQLIREKWNWVKQIRPQ